MYIRINEHIPQHKEIDIAADIIKGGGIIIYPTDTVYAIGCDIFNQRSIEKIAQLKKLNLQKSLFTFVCSDISEMSDYVLPIANHVFRTIKKIIPGPYTFILNANQNVPKVLKQYRKTVGIRIPDNNIVRDLVHRLGRPILSTSLINTKDDIVEYYSDPQEIYNDFKNKVDLIIDGGYGNILPSTVLDCTTDTITVIREGLGSVATL